MDWSSASAVWAQLEPLGVGLAAAITAIEFGLLLWLAAPGLRRRSAGPDALGAGASARRIAVGPGVALVAGAALTTLGMCYVQVPLQAAVERWMMSSLATANQAVLALPVILVSGLVQEPLKFLGAALGLAVGAPPKPATTAAAKAVLFGALAGVGFGGFEAAVILSAAHSTVVAAGLGFGAMTLALVERVLAVLFHLSATGIVVWAWARSVKAGLWTLVGMVVLHGLMNYAGIMGGASGGAVLAEGMVALTGIGLFILLVSLIRSRRPRLPGVAASSDEGSGR